MILKCGQLYQPSAHLAIHPAVTYTVRMPHTRKRWFVANWKMHFTPAQSIDFLRAFLPLLKRRPNRTVILCPSFPLIDTAARTLKSAGVKGKMVVLGAQNAHSELSGAYTGEVSAEQLTGIGCKYVILGHSERRALGETDQMINKKVNSALRAGLQPIVCVGESDMERRTGKTQAVLRRQIRACLANISQKNKILVAYEPMWAIGTGKTPTLPIIEDAHQTIRQASGVTRVLYGGSVNPQNIGLFLQSKEIDGFLAGTSSLEPESLAKMANML